MDATEATWSVRFKIECLSTIRFKLDTTDTAFDVTDNGYWQIELMPNEITLHKGLELMSAIVMVIKNVIYIM